MRALILGSGVAGVIAFAVPQMSSEGAGESEQPMPSPLSPQAAPAEDSADNQDQPIQANNQVQQAPDWLPDVLFEFESDHVAVPARDDVPTPEPVGQADPLHPMDHF